jgi:hypothetical protein
MKPKKKQESTTSELYYEVHCKKFVIHVHKGNATVLSGQPSQPGPKPGGGGQ